MAACWTMKPVYEEEEEDDGTDWAPEF